MWVIYALGGGWGHLTRAIALARVAQTPVTILTNSPFRNLVNATEAGITITSVSRDDVFPTILTLRPEVLIVDTFPRGLGGELADALPSITSRKVLIERDLAPDYVESFHLRAFVGANYDLIVTPGESERGAFSDLPSAHCTEPWLIRSRSELNPCELTDILICAAGNVEELAWYGDVAARLQDHNIRCIAPVCPPLCTPAVWTSCWPAIDWIAAARVVIGGAGYNTIHECLACQTPLVARPWPRLYDRQHRRAVHADAAIVDHPEEAVAAALRCLKEPRPAKSLKYANGVHEAAQFIRDYDCLSRSPRSIK